MAEQPVGRGPHGEDEDVFAREAAAKKESSIGEFWDFARHNKKWWMTPIIVILLLLGLLILVTGSGAGALIYPLF